MLSSFSNTPMDITLEHENKLSWYINVILNLPPRLIFKSSYCMRVFTSTTPHTETEPYTSRQPICAIPLTAREMKTNYFIGA